MPLARTSLSLHPLPEIISLNTREVFPFSPLSPPAPALPPLSCFSSPISHPSPRQNLSSSPPSSPSSQGHTPPGSPGDESFSRAPSVPPLLLLQVRWREKNKLESQDEGDMPPRSFPPLCPDLRGRMEEGDDDEEESALLVQLSQVPARNIAPPLLNSRQKPSAPVDHGSLVPGGSPKEEERQTYKAESL
eukprot:750270-Hanusia_phi.AAC.3